MKWRMLCRVPTMRDPAEERTEVDLDHLESLKLAEVACLLSCFKKSYLFKAPGHLALMVHV